MNAASVLPEPVGAAISALRPALISGQASDCTGVGILKCSSNHAATAGWNNVLESMRNHEPATNRCAVQTRVTKFQSTSRYMVLLRRINVLQHGITFPNQGHHGIGAHNSQQRLGRASGQSPCVCLEREQKHRK